VANDPRLLLLTLAEMLPATPAYTETEPWSLGPSFSGVNHPAEDRPLRQSGTH